MLIAVHHFDSIASLHLCFVKSLVGELDGAQGAPARGGLDYGDSDADGDSRGGSGCPVLDVQIRYGAADALSNFPSLGRVDIAENGRELLSSITGEDIRRTADHLLRRLGYPA
jgi:hypothetical protein